MTDVTSLLTRIDAEFNTADEKVATLHADRIHDYHAQQTQLDSFSRIVDELRDTWQSRLEAFAQRFGDRVQARPKIESARQEALLVFQSKLAQIRLRFSVAADASVQMLVFSCDLQIQPVLMQFDSHSQFEMPLDAINKESLANWIDERLVMFVRTYLSLHENEYYLKDHLVVDPVAHVRFPKFAAGATLEWHGTTIYFIGEETKREFETQHATADASGTAMLGD